MTSHLLRCSEVFEIRLK